MTNLLDCSKEWREGLLDYILYLALGSIEVFANYIFMFVLFCFPIRGNLIQIISASLIVILPSYVIRDLGFYGTDIVIQGIIITMSFWLIFRMAIHYAIIVMGVGYLFYGIIQFLIIYSLIIVQFVSLEEVLLQPIWGKMIQLVTAFIVLGISYALFRRRMHFSFIPNHGKTNIRYKHENTKLVIMVLVGFMVLLGGVWTIFEQNKWQVLLPLSGMGLALLTLFIVLFVNRDLKRGLRE